MVLIIALIGTGLAKCCTGPAGGRQGRGESETALAMKMLLIFYRPVAYMHYAGLLFIANTRLYIPALTSSPGGC
jgi:hypothetical protein